MLADSVQRIGARSGYGRDPRLHHHIRGLYLSARGQREDAIAEYRKAIWSPVAGYTRTNLELGRLLIDAGRPHEAIPVLSSALRGGLEASNLYVTHTEIRAVLSRAYAATGRADSAAIHRAWVERAVRDADAPARTHINRLMGLQPAT